MVKLENEDLKVWIKPKGAELKSLLNKNTGIEHLWDANSYYWAKSSPVLFPIVGGLRDNSYCYKGESYELPRHGFARDMVFEVESKSAEEAVFLLRSTEETLKVYPFTFELRLIYSLVANKLTLKYEVRNTDKNEMYFSVGGHPAFTVPFDGNGKYEDYKLVFNKDSALNIWPLTKEGLIKEESVSLELSENSLPLTKELFYSDALVVKDLKSNEITVQSDLNSNVLRFEFEGFPYFGVWAAKNADFVCLEPWCGIADGENHNQELSEKEGINKLETGQIFERSWSVELT